MSLFGILVYTPPLNSLPQLSLLCRWRRVHGRAGGRGGEQRGKVVGGDAEVDAGERAAHGRASPLGAVERLVAALEEQPLLLKALTSLVGFALGDILAQLFIQKTDPFDYARLFRLASSLVVFG